MQKNKKQFSFELYVYKYIIAQELNLPLSMISKIKSGVSKGIIMFRKLLRGK